MTIELAKHHVKYDFSFGGLPLPDGVQVRRVSIVEKLSDVYVGTVDLAGPPPVINTIYEELVGKSCKLKMERAVNQRKLLGIIRRVEYQGRLHSALQIGIRVEIVPALWTLSQRINSRIFQSLTTIDIVKKVVEEGLKPYKRKVDVVSGINGKYMTREYCVQHRETDLDFVMRLLQEEGISFYFDHTDKGPQAVETLVLVDHPAAFKYCGPLGPVEPPMPQLPVSVLGAADSVAPVQGLKRLSISTQLRPNKIALSDYNWLSPNVAVTGQNKVSDPTQAGSDREAFDSAPALTFAGKDKDNAAEQAELRKAGEESAAELGAGEGDIVQFCPGYTFCMLNHSRKRLNGTLLLLTKVEHHGAASEGLATGQDDASQGPKTYHNDFEVTLAKGYRPTRTIPRPVSSGPQTATVIGPKGNTDEVLTDEHGRVTVKFHWDRRQDTEEPISCSIRVAQSWAGPGYGALFVPRVGMEVVVEFLDGNLDRPLITGCVYNGGSPPPALGERGEGLPAGKTLSGWQTHSSGTSPTTGYNELSFEDAAGQEQVYLQAQKDWKILVKNNQDETVRGTSNRLVEENNHETIKGNRTETVGMTDLVTVGLARAVTVGGALTQTVGGAMNTMVGGLMGEEVGGARVEHVGGPRYESVGGDKQEEIVGASGLSVGNGETRSITGDLVEHVDGNVARKVSGDASVQVDGNDAQTIAKSSKVEVKEDRNIKVDKTDTLQVKEALSVTSSEGDIVIETKKKTITLKSKDTLTLTGGDGKSKIEITKDGIKITGKAITVEAQKELILKGQKVKNN